MPISYYYLHTNGELIAKRFRPERDPGGFVKRVWQIDTKNRATAWPVLIEGLALGARPERVADLASKWGCDNTDALKFIEHATEYEACVDLQKDNKWRVVPRTRPQGPHAGYGETVLEAMADLTKQLWGIGGSIHDYQYPGSGQ